jgi:hypothetical protein
VLHGNLDARTIDGLEAVARLNGTSLFAVLLAAFHLAVAEWSGAVHVAVAAPASRHRRADVPLVVGPFDGRVVVHTDHVRQLSFAAVLRRVDAALNNVAGEPGPHQYFFDLDDMIKPTVVLNALRLTRLELPSTVVAAPVTLTVGLPSHVRLVSVLDEKPMTDLLETFLATVADASRLCVEESI